MIEKILKKQKSSFLYGEVIAVDTAGQRVQVQTGEAIIWINTPLSLAIGDTVVCGRDETKQKFIIQSTSNVRPSVNTLLLV
jgi:NADH dehydrogenase FAD-containing subunit